MYDQKYINNIIVTWKMTREEYADLMFKAEEEIADAEDETDTE